MSRPKSLKTISISCDIKFLELILILKAFCIWALVAVLNKKTSKSKRVMKLVRQLVLQSMLHNVQFKAMHTAGKSIVIADALSRQQWSRFHQLFQERDLLLTPVPLPFNSLKLNVKKD
ncbi:hypothetical protein KUTeg_017188 [Tegillarca granosa]|uniref:Uncharacterized protein n=1 Tax=Tegillarca granosa TaxID=220873 RepID=A0ABQ9ETL1_TEGGR|nr:hypothetical protein KUTeg_017188 [Tegillarca granosa]